MVIMRSNHPKRSALFNNVNRHGINQDGPDSYGCIVMLWVLNDWANSLAHDEFAR